MKHLSLLLTSLVIILSTCLHVEAAPKSSVNTLNIYRAKVTMKRPLREPMFRGEYQTFEKGEFITDSEASSYTIKSYNQTNYLYGGELDSDYTSCLIPKANVSIESYETAPLSVSTIGNGCKYTDDEGNKYHIFIASRNNHRFHGGEYSHREAAKFNSTNRFCVITVKYNSSDYTAEFLLPIKNGIVEIGEILGNDWVNTNTYKYETYGTPSFDSVGKLISDMYPNQDKPEFWESVCYVPSKNALYIGYGKFMPLSNNDGIIEEPLPNFDEIKIYDIAEQQPSFNGNIDTWLAANLKYPPVAAEEGIEGRVIVQFVVGKDGSIFDATVVRGIEESLDREALRVVNSMPKWIPAKQNGEAVSCKYTFPVVFRLQ